MKCQYQVWAPAKSVMLSISLRFAVSLPSALSAPTYRCPAVTFASRALSLFCHNCSRPISHFSSYPDFLKKKCSRRKSIRLQYIHIINFLVSRWLSLLTHRRLSHSVFLPLVLFAHLNSSSPAANIFGIFNCTSKSFHTSPASHLIGHLFHAEVIRVSPVFIPFSDLSSSS